MNRGEIRAEVRKLLFEDDADFWADSELNAWINEGVRLMTKESHALQAIYQVSPELKPGSTSEYKSEIVLPSDVLEIFSVVCVNGNTKTKLRNRDFRMMAHSQRHAGVPTDYYLRRWTRQQLQDYSTGLQLSDIGTSGNLPTMVLGLNPVPSSANLLFWVHYYPTHYELLDDIDIPAIPIEARRGLIHYAAHLGFEKENSPEDSDRQLAKFRDYLGRLKEDQIHGGQMERFPVARIVNFDEDCYEDSNVTNFMYE